MKRLQNRRQARAARFAHLHAKANEYDLIDRLAVGQQFESGQLSSSSRYVYDPLNRPTQRQERTRLADGVPEQADLRRFEYVGLSDSVSRETWDPVREGPEKDVVKEYSYDADGTRVAFTAKRGDNPARELTYGYNAHGDVSLVLGDDGDAKASYGYLAFGDEDRSLTREQDFESPAASDEHDPSNAYRYSAKRTDPGTDTLDMGARRYSPGVGGFLQADQYQDANLGLSTDPLTGNRYSLAAGNPVSFIETDGHMPTPVDGEDARKIGARQAAAGVQLQRQDPAPKASSGPGPAAGGGQQDAASGNAANSRAQLQQIQTSMQPYKRSSDVPYNPNTPSVNIQGDSDPFGDWVVSTFIGHSPAEIALNIIPVTRPLKVAFAGAKTAYTGAKTLGRAASRLVRPATEARPTVNWGSQGKHLPGHANHIPGRSQLTADPRKLVERAGSGQPVGSVPRGQPGFRERIDFGDEIGTYVDPVTGSEVATTRGILHYGKTGVHIVPARPR